MIPFLLAQSLQPVPDPDVVAAAAAAAAAVLKTAESTRSAWSDPLVIGMIGGQMILVIGAIASGVVMVLNRATVRQIQEQAQSNTAGLLVVAKDTEAIKGHVNSEKTAAEGRQNTLVRENELLREMLNEKKTTAALLAQAASHPRTQRAADGQPLAVKVVNQPEVVVANTPLAVATEPPPSNGLTLKKEDLNGKDEDKESS